MQEFKSFSVKMNTIATILFIINGIIASTGAQQYGSHFLIFGVVALILLGLNTLRLAKFTGDDITRVGEVTVQGGWIWTSFSLVYITMAPAGIYEMIPSYMAVVEVIGVVLLFSGVYVLLKAKKETGVALSV